MLGKNTMAATFALSVILAGCGSKDDTGATGAVEVTGTGTGSAATGTGMAGTGTGGMTGTGTGTATGSTAMLRVVHLSPDAPTVDIFLDNGADPAVPGASFEDGTGYLTVPAGTHSVQISAEGDSAQDAVYEVPSLTLGDGGSYTAVAHGYLAGTPAPFMVTALGDTRDGIPTGSFRVQVVHAAAASAYSQVDVWDVTGATPAPLIPDFDYGTAVTADLPAGQYTVCLDVNDDAACDATFALPNLTDGFINLYAVNDVAENPFLLAHLEDGTILRIDAS